MKTELTNYAQWSKIFDEIEVWEIGHIDSQITEAIQQGKIKWVLGTAERFTNRLIDVVNIRFNKLNMFYNNRIKTCRDFFEFSKILISFRKELVFLKTLVNIDALPDDIKEELTENIITFAINTQKSLEENAKKDLSGELKRLVLGNRIDNI